MSTGAERHEPWGAKLAYVLAFLVAAVATYLVSMPIRNWVVVAYPELAYWFVVHAVIGCAVAAPVFFIEDGILVRIAQRNAFNSIRPVTTGVIVGYALPYVLVA